MATYLLRRLLLMIPTVLGITLMVFLLVALAPGGIGAGLAVQGGQMSDTSKVAQMQAYLEDRYGLNDPVLVQYARWLHRISPVKFGVRDQVTPAGERLHGAFVAHARQTGLLLASDAATDRVLRVLAELAVSHCLASEAAARQQLD